MKKQKNILSITEKTLKLFFFATLIFIISFISTDLIQNNNKIMYDKNEYHDNTYYSNMSKALDSIQDINNDEYYIMFKNTEPSIKQIEMFLAKNQHNLSEQQLDYIEQIRNKRITEIMAKKYINMNKTN